MLFVTEANVACTVQCGFISHLKAVDFELPKTLNFTPKSGYTHTLAQNSCLQIDEGKVHTGS